MIMSLSKLVLLQDWLPVVVGLQGDIMWIVEDYCIILVSTVIFLAKQLIIQVF